MQDLIRWIFAQQRFGIKPGLERVEKLLERLNRPEKTYDIVLVAGTNGKGSTASTLASISQTSGKRTGLFTSPHLTYFAERFRINGEPVAEDELLRTLKKLERHAEAIGATFFEIVTVLAYVLFARAKVDIAVIEVGMGGRYDATNAADPVLSILTNVSLDHTAILGSSIEEIALDKAGIMRPNVVTLTGATGDALDVLQKEAKTVGADLRPLGAVDIHNVSWAGVEFSLATPAGQLELHTPLLGEHQAANVALAALAAQELGIDKDAIWRGVRETAWPGRLERLTYKGRPILLDGAHNPAAAGALAETLQTLGVADLVLILGLGADKDAEGIVTPLLGLDPNIIVTRSMLSPRALETADLKELVPKAKLAQTPQGALNLAVKTSGPETLILIAGSLYLVGEMRPLILGKQGEKLERWQ